MASKHLVGCPNRMKHGRGESHGAQSFRGCGAPTGRAGVHEAASGEPALAEEIEKELCGEEQEPSE